METKGIKGQVYVDAKIEIRAEEGSSKVYRNIL